MKTIAAVVCLVFSICQASSQSNKSAVQVIEGGKVVVELIKAFAGKKDLSKDQGCTGKHADLCITNSSSISIAVSLQHRGSNLIREMVIQPETQECCLQINTGVWTYDLHQTGAFQSIRKGDLLIEGCQNVFMKLTY